MNTLSATLENTTNPEEDLSNAPVQQRPLAPTLSIAERDQLFRQLVVGEQDAKRWLESMATVPDCSHFAIEVDNQAMGAIGVMIGQGIFSKTAEFGYWIGEAWWGRGIASAASLAFSRFVMHHFQLHRLQAYVFEWNPRSMRVLEKCGFAHEAILARSAVKDGQVVNEHLYALTDRQLRTPDKRINPDYDSQRGSTAFTVS